MPNIVTDIIVDLQLPNVTVDVQLPVYNISLPIIVDMELLNITILPIEIIPVCKMFLQL